MVLAIVMLLGIVVLMFYLRKKIEDMYELIVTRIDELTAISLKPVKKATDIAKMLLSATRGKRSRFHHV